MVDRAFIQKKLDRLAEYIADLEEQQHVSVTDWETNKMLRNHIERTLHKAVENCLDIGKHLIAGMGLRTPEDYKDIMVILAEAGILPKENFKIRAVEEGTTVREIVVAALRRWLRSRNETGEGLNRTAVERLNEVRRRIFGNRVLPGSSADLIREAREDRLEANPY